jgi:hypothetical protein
MRRRVAAPTGSEWRDLERAMVWRTAVWTRRRDAGYNRRQSTAWILPDLDLLKPTILPARLTP